MSKFSIIFLFLYSFEKILFIYLYKFLNKKKEKIDLVSKKKILSSFKHQCLIKKKNVYEFKKKNAKINKLKLC
jgi:hypothetical protein